MKSLIASITSRLLPGGAFSSRDYWVRRYRTGGNSGPGSYGHLAKFKADVLNEFVGTHVISSVIELGCGDGNQLTMAKYPTYTGYDISETAVKACRKRFADDPAKEFFLAKDYDGRKADLALSLDVIFHLTEDGSFDAYMRRLFDASLRYVVLYSSNSDDPIRPTSIHVRHRRFTDWTDNALSSGWKLARTIPNAYPYDGDYQNTSFSDFFIYEKT